MDKEERARLKIYNQDIREICRSYSPDDYTEQIMCIAEDELQSGFLLTKKHPSFVTFFGSARTDTLTDEDKSLIEGLAKRLVEEFDVTIATGGGPGAMEYANKGAYSVNKERSIAMAIELPEEQALNQYISDYVYFRFFFTRKLIMTYSAEAFVVCPGGFGTLNELFEILTLEQTRKAQPAPVILLGTSFWGPLMTFIHETIEKRGMTDFYDDTLFHVTDDIEEVVELFKRFNILRK